MAEIVLANVTKSYPDGAMAVHDLSLRSPKASSSSWSGLPAVESRPR